MDRVQGGDCYGYSDYGVYGYSYNPTYVTVYEPIGLHADVGPERRDELELWHRALRAYRARQWDQAGADLLALQRMAPVRELYTVFSGKVAEKRHNPPASDWDGVTVFDET